MTETEPTARHAAPARPAMPGTGARTAGVITWLVAVTPLWWLVARNPELLAVPRVAGAVVAGLVFGASFLPGVRGDGASLRRSVAVGLVQVVAGLVAAALVPFPLHSAPTPALMAVVALPQFVFLGRERTGLAVIALQTAALALIYAEPMGSSTGALLFVASVLGFQLFAFSAARLAAREARAREALAAALDELSAAQAVLAAGERLGERVRIARDLHDAIGHHLTTLSLHLDLARRQEAVAARQTVDTAHSICRVLLAELRDVLADVRSADAEDLARSIRDLATRVPGLEIDVRVADELGALDPAVAQLALRAVQEAVTNALRHAGANRATIAVSREGEQLHGRIADDGRGFAGMRAGGGLAALRDRFATAGGALDARSGDGGRGTVVTFELPAGLGGSGAAP